MDAHHLDALRGAIKRGRDASANTLLRLLRPSELPDESLSGGSREDRRTETMKQAYTLEKRQIMSRAFPKSDARVYNKLIAWHSRRHCSFDAAFKKIVNLNNHIPIRWIVLHGLGIAL